MPTHHHPPHIGLIAARSDFNDAAPAEQEGATEATDTDLEVSTNALGLLFAARFAEPDGPCKTYSELMRRSGVSRESISRYISARPERHRSPTIDTLEALADAVGLPLALLCRAAIQPGPLTDEQRQGTPQRAAEAAPLLEQLSEARFQALLTFLRRLLAAE